MAKRYDATLKHIFDVDPEKLVALLRLAAANAFLVEARRAATAEGLP